MMNKEQFELIKKYLRDDIRNKDCVNVFDYLYEGTTTNSCETSYQEDAEQLLDLIERAQLEATKKRQKENEKAISNLLDEYGIKHYQDMSSIIYALRSVLDKRLMPEGTEWPKFEDGDPVLVGDEFETMVSGTKKVDAIKFKDGYIFSLEFNNGCDTAEFYKNARVKRPERRETLQDVIDDYDKSITEYWKCSTIPCSRCPSEINCKTPQDYYGTMGCDAAKWYDIKRRLEAIQERMGGER